MSTADAPLSKRVSTRKPGRPTAVSTRRKLALPGAKRRKSTGGAMKPLGNDVDVLKDQRGPYLDPKVKLRLEWQDLCIERRPISEHAKKLVDDYVVRDAFWTAIYRFGATVERAGELILRLQKRRVEQIYKELLNAGGPYEWFKGKALEGFLSKRIASGAATERSGYADQFFSLIVGPDRDAIQARAFGGCSKVTLNEAMQEVDDLGDLAKQHIRYLVFSVGHPTTEPDRRHH